MPPRGLPCWVKLISIARLPHRPLRRMHLQITAEAESTQGRLLLAARSGRLSGLHLPDAGLNVTALLMEQVRGLLGGWVGYWV